MTGQVITRATGVLLGFEISQNPFMTRPSFKEVADLPFEQKLAELRRPERRARILEEETDQRQMAIRLNTWDHVFPLRDPPDYEPPVEHSVGAMAGRAGVPVEALVYDLMLEEGGHALLYRPLSNYAYGNLDTVHDMISHPDTLIGLGDGGAHVSIICDSSALTYMLTHWARDRRGARFPIEWAVKRLTSDNARALGLHDRGVLAPGRKADINVIDFERLQLRRPRVVYDLPHGGRRLIQTCDGYEATIVAGVPVYREGQATGALPGRLIRGTRPA
jgi:N-acyl-D-aspartate/D-glutamate deacylase